LTSKAITLWEMLLAGDLRLRTSFTAAIPTPPFELSLSASEMRATLLVLSALLGHYLERRLSCCVPLYATEEILPCNLMETICQYSRKMEDV